MSCFIITTIEPSLASVASEGECSLWLSDVLTVLEKPGTVFISKALRCYKVGFGEPRKGRFGSMLRNHLGEWIKGNYRHLGSSSNILAELWGLRDGLEVEVDCKDVLILVEEPLNTSHMIAGPYWHPLRKQQSAMSTTEELTGWP
ncbi:hypothetical protein ACH5RR_018970 [Cinchona calisaya]|uniref:Uncharacterized protein n=1 Tax=Cinchona calisaya TaxID=153742 RepID=A0ABD2ZMZ7_9GENT